jgi:hypothetical protein
MADSNNPEWNVFTDLPFVVVPSGKQATHCPRRKIARIRFATPASPRELPRLRNTVPVRAASHPISGQRRTSPLATNRTRRHALMTRLSSHETWFPTKRTDDTLAGGVSP